MLEYCIRVLLSFFSSFVKMWLLGYYQLTLDFAVAAYGCEGLFLAIVIVVLHDLVTFPCAKTLVV